MNEDLTVEFMKNGPIVVTGLKVFENSDGKKQELKNGIAYFCRCGHSKNKPHCDGSHKKVNFNDEI